MTITKIPDQIITQPLQPLTLPRVDSIALHHMASEGDVKAIEAAHIRQGWRAIGYNYWVDYDGTVYEGRGLHLGAGVTNENGHTISIGFRGDYHSKPKAMPDPQFNAGIDLILWLLKKVPKAKVKGHKEFGGTVCPGRYFPLEEMKRLQRREEPKMIYNYMDKNMPDWARATVQKLMDKGALQGNEKGELNLTEEMLRLLVIHDRMGLYE